MTATYHDRPVRLADKADTTHEDAREWYDSYGWHLTTDRGDVILQAVEYDWLDEDDDTTCTRLITEQDITAADAAEIVEMAQSVRGMAEEVEGLLDAAVAAYEAGDLAGTIAALAAAGHREGDAGDSPATQALAAQLLEAYEAGDND